MDFLDFFYLIGALTAAALLAAIWMRRRMDALHREEIDALERSSVEQQNALQGKLDDQQRRLDEQRELLQAEIQELRASEASLQTRLEIAEQMEGKREEELNAVSDRFQHEFENLAQKIFEEKAKALKHRNKDQLQGLLSPLQERLELFEKSIRENVHHSTQERSALKQQILQLTELNHRMLEDARNLTHALKGDTKVQGNWGEMILERVLEKSGLVQGREYHVQQVQYSEQGRRLQPDVIVDLPQDRKVIIDAKVSLTAWERYVSAADEQERKVQAKAHRDSLRSHIKLLSAKNYQQLYGMQSPDFVLLFVPIEPAFSLALAEDESLYVDAFERNIVIVTPSTLLATLSTVASLWKQEYQNRHVHTIAQQAGALYDKFYGLYNDLVKLGKRLRLSQQSYDDTLNKLSSGKGNLINRVEKLRELGAQSSKTLPKELIDKASEDGELPFGDSIKSGNQDPVDLS
jgi:DNA recombination protein RmuC